MGEDEILSKRIWQDNLGAHCSFVSLKLSWKVLANETPPNL